MNTFLFPASVARASAGLALAMGMAPSYSGGFQLNETSGSGLGNAYAGGAAIAEDASTVWSNVAGMSRIRTRQLVVAGHLIAPSLEFRNEASQAGASQALGGRGGNAGDVALIPNLYAVQPIATEWSVGMGFSTPWGLGSKYDTGWMGRFQTVKSDIRTYNLNPGISWKPAQGLSLGLGLNYQHIDATLSNQINYSGALLNAAALAGIAPGSGAFNAIAASTTGLESSARIKGNDNGTGWNVGALWELGEKTRFGVSYRSSIKYRIAGKARFSNPTPVVAPPLAATVAALAAGVNGNALFDSGITADAKLPSIANLSYFQTLNERWDVMADAQWTRWSTIQSLTFVRSDGTVLQSIPENFRNAWKLAFGANYRYDSQWMLRGGLAFDQSPVERRFRNARLPDANKAWLTAGLQFPWGQDAKVDIGAAYLLTKKARINANGAPASTAANGLLSGHYDSSTLIVSGQITYRF